MKAFDNLKVSESKEISLIVRLGGARLGLQVRWSDSGSAPVIIEAASLAKPQVVDLIDKLIGCLEAMPDALPENHDELPELV